MSDNNFKDIAKAVVKNLTEKPAAIDKKIGAESSKDLFGAEVAPEPASKDYSDVDLFGHVTSQAKADRSDAVLPEKVENTDSGNDNSEVAAELNQGYESSSSNADNMYTGSGDGPEI